MLSGHGRPLVACLLALAVSRATLAATSADVARRDAQLNDVTFVDPQHGWAVGDRGVIWTTSDGGGHWRLQNSGVDCRLTSVAFVDEKTGWAVGGVTQPYTHASSGVLLRTRDGGERWQRDTRLMLPAIARIKFLDVSHGWAITAPSPLFPSAVFSTDDGGRSWSSMPAAEAPGFVTGDFCDMRDGALAGADGSLAVVRRRVIESAPSASFGLRLPRQLRLTDTRHGWLVGDGGMVMKTDDLGHAWQTPPEDIPSGLRELFDFAALAARGQRVWIAGSPGSIVLRSSDGGQSWQTAPTGYSTPIRALHFIDDYNGWAVGDLGAILVTRDGGETWSRQQAGGARAALLGVYSRSDQVPWELLAKVSAEEGYLGAIDVVTRESGSVDLSRATPATRLQDATVAAGGSMASMAWRFPLSKNIRELSAEEIIEQWNRANDGRALERLDEHLVAMIRCWRPSVVFTTALGRKSSDAGDRLINQAVLRAVGRAADPKIYPDQIAIAGLAPWRTDKIFSSASNDESGAIVLSGAEIASRLGVSLGEAAAEARGLIADRYETPASGVGFRLLVDGQRQSGGYRDFFGGLNLAPGSEARRRLADPIEQNVDDLRRQVMAQRNLQAILGRAESDDAVGASYLAELGNLTKTVSDRRAAEVLYQLAQRYERRGQWEMAAETHEALVNRSPTHPLACASLVWLVQYYSSSEAEWRTRRVQSRVTDIVRTGEPVVAASHVEPDNKDLNRAGIPRESASVVPAGGLAAAAQMEHRQSLSSNRRGEDLDRAVKASACARRLEELNAGLSFEPEVRFPLSAAQRKSGAGRSAERYYLGLRRAIRHDAWWACAEGEDWLTRGEGVSPKKIYKCPRAAAKPHLDGKLDEAIWRAVEPMELHTVGRHEGELPTMALAAYDNDFLYLAISCTRAPNGAYEASAEPRPRDADLDQHDRVSFYLDLDRDFSTYYRFTIDHRGWTAESCWNDTTWNPNWYVASGQTDGVWTAEAAIPITELAPQSPTARQAWTLGVERVIPGAGEQSWTRAADSDAGPQGFGYLIFD